jgi:hypothetical protein
VDSKVLIKRLLRNLQPKSTRIVIEALQDAGTAQQKKTRTCMTSFHAMLVEISQTNKKALDYGLFAVASRPSRNLALSASTQATGSKNRATFGEKPVKKSAAAIAENGCKNHGEGAYHGTSECYLERPDLAPDGFDKEAALENIKRRKTKWSRSRSKVKLTKAAKAKLVSSAQTTSSEPDSEEVRRSDAFSFISGRAFSARAPSSTTGDDPYAFLSLSSDSNTSVDDPSEPISEHVSNLDVAAVLDQSEDSSQTAAETTAESETIFRNRGVLAERSPDLVAETVDETDTRTAGNHAGVTDADETVDEQTAGNFEEGTLAAERLTRQDIDDFTVHSNRVYTNLWVLNDVCPSIFLCYWLEPQWTWDNVRKMVSDHGPHGNHYG